MQDFSFCELTRVEVINHLANWDVHAMISQSGLGQINMSAKLCIKPSIFISILTRIDHYHLYTIFEKEDASTCDQSFCGQVFGGQICDDQACGGQACDAPICDAPICDGHFYVQVCAP